MFRNFREILRGQSLFLLIWAGNLFPVASIGGDNGEVDQASENPVIQPGIVEEVVDSSFRFEIDERSPIRAGFTLEGYHDSNVFISPPGEELDDFVWEMVPEVRFESSRPGSGKRGFLEVGYDPMVRRYTDFAEIDSTDHRGFGQFYYRGARFETEFRQRSAQFSGSTRETEELLLSNTDADVGRRTSGKYHLSRSKTLIGLTQTTDLELIAGRYLRAFESETTAGYEEWLGGIGLLCQVTPKTQIGIVPRFGHVDIAGSPEHNYQEALARFVFDISSRWNFELRGGEEFREFSGKDATDGFNTPVYLSRLDWSPSQATTIAVEGYREVRHSVGGDAIVQNGIRGSFEQRIFGKCYYLFRGGLDRNSYEASREDEFTDRKDQYLFIGNRLEYRMGDHLRAGIFHEFRRNESDGNSNFKRGQSGFRLSVRF